MKSEFTALIEHGDSLLVASCPELPEANGQGATRDEALRDLAASIQSVLEFRREDAMAHAAPGFEKTTVLVG